VRRVYRGDAGCFGRPEAGTLFGRRRPSASLGRPDRSGAFLQFKVTTISNAGSRLIENAGTSRTLPPDPPNGPGDRRGLAPNVSDLNFSRFSTIAIHPRILMIASIDAIALNEQGQPTPTNQGHRWSDSRRTNPIASPDSRRTNPISTSRSRRTNPIRSAGFREAWRVRLSEAILSVLPPRSNASKSAGRV
jgi:hypothetical protein